MRSGLPADAKSPRVLCAHRVGDFAGDGLIDDLALADDEQPIVGCCIDGAIQFRAMLGQRIIERNIEHELLEVLQVRRQRAQLLGMNVTERDHAEAHYSSTFS